jgi:flagella basal body P-ring formation protein FlgA
MMDVRHRLTTQIAAALLISCPPALESHAAAQTKYLHPPEDIVQYAMEAALAAARAMGYQRLSADARPLDTRLALPQCEQPLQIHRSPRAQVLGPVSIGVRCPGPTSWKLFVRLEISSEIDLPVLRAALPRGSVLRAEDLTVQRQRVTTMPQTLILQRSQLEGQVLTRDTPAGTPLQLAQIKAPYIVERGQNVTLIAGGDGISVSMQGRALSNAIAGGRVMVLNLSSGRQVEGLAESDGRVRIR